MQQFCIICGQIRNPLVYYFYPNHAILITYYFVIFCFLPIVKQNSMVHFVILCNYRIAVEFKKLKLFETFKIKKTSVICHVVYCEHGRIV